MDIFKISVLTGSKVDTFDNTIMYLSELELNLILNWILIVYLTGMIHFYLITKMLYLIYYELS